MALTSFVIVPPEIREKYHTSLRSSDRFTLPRVVRNSHFVSRRRRIDLRNRSLFGLIADFWRPLSSETKHLWRLAGAEMNLYNWPLFISDTAARLSLDLPGLATPKTTHQAWVGQMLFPPPESGDAGLFRIAQFHSRDYWVRRRDPVQNNQFVPILVRENFALPFTISVSYFSDLSLSGPNPLARFYANIWSSYQGQDIQTPLVLDFNLQSDWQRVSASISSVPGHIIGYVLFIQLNDVSGKLLFDNVRSIHSNQNWARDPGARNINAIFPRGFQQVPPHWAGIDVPDRASFESVYP